MEPKVRIPQNVFTFLEFNPDTFCFQEDITQIQLCILHNLLVFVSPCTASCFISFLFFFLFLFIFKQLSCVAITVCQHVLCNKLLNQKKITLNTLPLSYAFSLFYDIPWSSVILYVFNWCGPRWIITQVLSPLVQFFDYFFVSLTPCYYLIRIVAIVSLWSFPLYYCLGTSIEGQ